MDKPTTKELAYFLDKVKITNRCWLWIGSLSIKGYGEFGYRGKKIRSHRFSYRMFVGPIEQDKFVLHRRECGNPSCVNPRHLYQGTHIDNMRDRKLWGKGYYGNATGRATLSANDVLNIRRIHNNKKSGYSETARIFNVDPSTIRRVVTGKAWKHLPL